MRFAVIGTNFITDRFLAAAKKADGFVLKAVYSRTEERAAEYAKTYGAELIFTSLDKMARCKDIDAVYIASPNALHKEQSILMLSRGKHVLCEKPIASNLNEYKEMQKAAKKSGKLLMEAMKQTFYPTVKIIQDNLKKIAPIRRGTFTYCQYSSRYDKYKQGIMENAFNPELSNGALMDIGCYPLHNMLMFMGVPKKILAKSVFLSSGIDGEGTILAKYDGMLAEVMYSKISDTVIPSEIQGERGCITIDKMALHRKIMLYERGGKVTDLSVSLDVDDMVYELREFMKMAESGEYNREYADYSAEALRIMDEARRQTGLVFPSDYNEE